MQHRCTIKVNRPWLTIEGEQEVALVERYGRPSYMSVTAKVYSRVIAFASTGRPEQKPKLALAAGSVGLPRSYQFEGRCHGEPCLIYDELT